MKPVTLRMARFITPSGESEPIEYPSSTPSRDAGGGTISYDYEIVGAIPGLSAEATKVFVMSVVGAMTMQIVQGVQDESAIIDKIKKRWPYMRALEEVVDLNAETYALLMPRVEDALR